MGKHYNQLSLDERIEISRLRTDGVSGEQIGKVLGRHPATIYRELARNRLPKSGYKPAAADHMAFVRRKRCSRIERLNPLRTLVVDRLAMGWSPQQIAGRLKLQGGEHTISHESIYRFIYRCKARPDRLYRYLARAKATRGRRYFKRRRAPIPDRLGIANRPQHIATREEFGHWEGDLMQFRTQRGNLLTLCERKTRFSLTFPLPSKRAEPTAQAVAEQFAALPPGACKSITFDRGGEFAHHHMMTQQTGADIWFCDPHSPWQRGTIENTNGIFRRDLPRKADYKDYSAQDFENLTGMINSTPRKCLGYKTPAEAFMENLTVALEM
jgi:IS30 family transposase